MLLSKGPGREIGAQKSQLVRTFLLDCAKEWLLLLHTEISKNKKEFFLEQVKICALRLNSISKKIITPPPSMKFVPKNF